MLRCLLAAIIVTYVLAVIQSTVGGRLAVLGVAPDLLLVWSICLGISSGAAAGAVAGWGSGLLEGCMQQAWLAPCAVSKAVSGFAAGELGARMHKDNWLVPAVCAMVLTVANEVIFLLLSRAGFSAHAARVIGVRICYHALLAPLALAAIGRGRRALDRGRWGRG
jgi:rod shape-determining protein MreD